MKARQQLTGDQLVQDYLARVAQAARLLPKGARIAFVGRTRALVEREVGATELADADRVMVVLESLGKPEDLVREERMRIDQRWVKSRASTKAEGEAAAAALTGPRMNRPLRARRRPSSDTLPLIPQPTPPPGDAITGPVVPRQAVSPEEIGPQDTGPVAAGPAVTGPAVPGPAVPGQAVTGPAVPGQAVTGPAATGTEGTEPGSTGPAGSLDWLSRSDTGAHGSATPLSNAGQLARAHILETAATLLLGLGGLILPFPFWPLGAVVAMFSRLWDVKDKSVAVVGPLVVALVTSVVTAIFIGGHNNFILTYTHALRVDFSLMVRLGAVVSAAYLAWRVSQGPRIKVPPWRRYRR